MGSKLNQGECRIRVFSSHCSHEWRRSPPVFCVHIRHLGAISTSFDESLYDVEMFKPGGQGQRRCPLRIPNVEVSTSLYQSLNNFKPVPLSSPKQRCPATGVPRIHVQSAMNQAQCSVGVSLIHRTRQRCLCICDARVC